MLSVEKARVQKFIASSGFCSRRKAEEYIAQGRVLVNGKVVSLGDHCTQKDQIRVSGRKIVNSGKDKVYFVLNKPKNHVCSNSDDFNSKTVFDIVKYKGLFSVGRLDKNTTGLLILTNDGQFSQSVIHPSKKIEKEYFLKLDRELDPISWKSIEKGLVLDGFKLSPCKISKVKSDKYSITIFEGKKRQIRRIFEMKGYKVIDLHRERIGKLRLKKFNLAFGEYKKVKLRDLTI